MAYIIKNRMQPLEKSEEFCSYIICVWWKFVFEFGKCSGFEHFWKHNGIGITISQPNKRKTTTTTTASRTFSKPYKFTKMIEIVCMFSETLWGLIQFTNIKHFSDIIFIKSFHINQHWNFL